MENHQQHRRQIIKGRLLSFASMSIFGLIFVLGGLFFPDVYLRYIDKTQYIHYVGNVTFDKKVYAPCETQIAQSTFVILIDSPVEIKSRLYLQKSDNGNTNQVIKEYSFDSFLVAETSPQVHITKNDLPCDLEPGVYFYRGILTYNIRGINKTTGFASEQFTIEDKTGGVQ